MYNIDDIVVTDRGQVLRIQEPFLMPHTEGKKAWEGQWFVCVDEARKTHAIHHTSITAVLGNDPTHDRVEDQVDADEEKVDLEKHGWFIDAMLDLLTNQVPGNVADEIFIRWLNYVRDNRDTFNQRVQDELPE